MSQSRNMATSSADAQAQEAPLRDTNGLLPGLLSWITQELIDHTINVWQPHYKVPLTQAEAIAMIRNVSRLGEVFAAIDDALSCRHPPPA